VLIGAVLIFMSIPRRHLVAQVTLNKAVLGKFCKKEVVKVSAAIVELSDAKGGNEGSVGEWVLPVNSRI